MCASFRLTIDVSYQTTQFIHSYMNYAAIALHRHSHFWCHILIVVVVLDLRDRSFVMIAIEIMIFISNFIYEIYFILCSIYIVHIFNLTRLQYLYQNDTGQVIHSNTEVVTSYRYPIETGINQRHIMHFVDIRTHSSDTDESVYPPAQ